MDGILNLNKPPGITSHDLVQAVRRLLSGVKAGHAGTLDPEATGVLPVCCGRATRLAEYLMELPKGYRAVVTLGVVTDTGDAAGQVLERNPVAGVTRERLLEVCAGLRGPQEQLPPLYSAVKHRGKPLYYWTRRGKEVPRRPRTVNIYRLELAGFDSGHEPRLHLEVECSRGTYIRTLASEIGGRLGCGAHLASLERSFVGPFRIEESHGPEALARAVAEGRAAALFFPLEKALAHLPPVTLGREALRSLAQGKRLSPESAGLVEPGAGAWDGGPLRVHDPQGRLLAIARWSRAGEEAVLKTEKFLVPVEVDNAADEAD